MWRWFSFSLCVIIKKIFIFFGYSGEERKKVEDENKEVDWLVWLNKCLFEERVVVILEEYDCFRLFKKLNVSDFSRIFG